MHEPCPHCHAKATPVSCVECNRPMCEDCIHFGPTGKVCGLCLDRLTEPTCETCGAAVEPGHIGPICDACDCGEEIT